jgi:MscS family membrane protein
MSSVAAGGLVFAGKDLFGNYLGALTIYLDKPFKVGDWIYLPEKNIEGVVEKIGLRVTQIRTFEKRPIYVPNASFATDPIENASRMSHRRLQETFGLRFEDMDQVEDIITGIEKDLKSLKEIDFSLPHVVSLKGYNAISANIIIYLYSTAVEMEDFYRFRQKVMLIAHKHVDRHGAKMASFPPTVVEADPVII